MTTTKITGLTGLNVAALEQAQREGILSPEVKITKTTATFPWSPAETQVQFRYSKADMAAKHGSRQHPVAPLHAVERKINRAANV